MFSERLKYTKQPLGALVVQSYNVFQPLSYFEQKSHFYGTIC